METLRNARWFKFDIVTGIGGVTIITVGGGTATTGGTGTALGSVGITTTIITIEGWPKRARYDRHDCSGL